LRLQKSVVSNFLTHRSKRNTAGGGSALLFDDLLASKVDIKVDHEKKSILNINISHKAMAIDG